MFCSTLQQHLGEIGQGEYTHGQPQHPSLSPEVRLRIRRRVMSEYNALFYGRKINFPMVMLLVCEPPFPSTSQ